MQYRLSPVCFCQARFCGAHPAGGRLSLGETQAGQGGKAQLRGETGSTLLSLHHVLGQVTVAVGGSVALLSKEEGRQSFSSYASWLETEDGKVLNWSCKTVPVA